jgi:hypothetical protein
MNSDWYVRKQIYNADLPCIDQKVLLIDVFHNLLGLMYSHRTEDLEGEKQFNDCFTKWLRYAPADITKITISYDKQLDELPWTMIIAEFRRALNILCNQLHDPGDFRFEAVQETNA